MGLLQDWQAIALMKKQTGVSCRISGALLRNRESVYEKLLSNPDEAVEGTVKELAERFEIEVIGYGRISGWYRRESCYSEQPGRSDRRFSCESCFR